MIIIFLTIGVVVCKEILHTVLTSMAPKKRELTVDEKVQIHCFLLEHTVNGKLLHGAVSQAAEKFDCDRKSIWRVQKLFSSAEKETQLRIVFKSNTSN